MNSRTTCAEWSVPPAEMPLPHFAQLSTLGVATSRMNDASQFARIGEGQRASSDASRVRALRPAPSLAPFSDVSGISRKLRAG
ncbi:MAG TPA: hypothetical protein VHM25_08070, partial [Polyangiaceae bacterium]|nr:hypothetical protein [Polyangiaceae bacterium]